MRFLCENCKAKYQIADEKLAGRAVRMKCRKCGHVIDVPMAEVKAPSSTAAGTPPAPAVSPVAPPVAPKPVPPSATRPQRPGAAPAAPHAPAGRPAPPSPQSSAARTAPRPPTAQPPASASAGGLAGAFSRTVREPAESDVSAAIEVLSAGAGEEWYVGINGVPLGPVRLSAIRQKASQGVINEESLVWREGFEEWLPLRSFPELLTLLNEAREQGARASFAPPAPSTTRKPLSQPPPPAAQIQGVAAIRPLARGAGMGALDMSPTVPVSPIGGDDEEFATIVAPAPSAGMGAEQVLADPFGRGSPLQAPIPAAGSPAQPAFAPVARVDIPPSRPSVPPDDALPRRSLVDDLAVGVRRQVRMHPAAYVLIALAGGFGVTGAVVVFSSEKTVAAPPTIQVVTVAAPAATAPVADPNATASAGAAARDLGEVAVAPRVGGPLPGAPADTAREPADTVKQPGDPPPRAGLGDGPNVAGPTVGGPAAGGGSVPQLEQADIERVVASQRAAVKRRCWEPAIASRDPSAPPSAKVNVSVTIGSDGRVRGASASGGDGYPGLASCVQQRVSSWTFPPSGGESRANIPFAFFSQ